MVKENSYKSICSNWKTNESLYESTNKPCLNHTISGYPYQNKKYIIHHGIALWKPKLRLQIVRLQGVQR